MQIRLKYGNDNVIIEFNEDRDRIEGSASFLPWISEDILIEKTGVNISDFEAIEELDENRIRPIREHIVREGVDSIEKILTPYKHIDSPVSVSVSSISEIEGLFFPIINALAYYNYIAGVRDGLAGGVFPLYGSCGPSSEQVFLSSLKTGNLPNATIVYYKEGDEFHIANAYTFFAEKENMEVTLLTDSTSNQHLLGIIENEEGIRIRRMPRNYIGLFIGKELSYLNYKHPLHVFDVTSLKKAGKIVREYDENVHHDFDSFFNDAQNNRIRLDYNHFPPNLLSLLL